MKLFVTALLCLCLSILHGQNAETKESIKEQDSISYVAKMIRTSRMNMEYMDFGGEGNVLIHIQGVHNASALEDNFMYYQNFVHWRDMLTQASKHYRVYAPIYRGYGNSDKEGEDIFKVENIAKDILAFMDQMNIQNASLIGRTTAPQVMFYLAEHHPDRIDAMIVSDNSMYKTIPISNEEIKEFMYYCSYAATDLGDRAPAIVMPSYDYEPKFYTDETQKINIPLYWPYSEEMNIIKMNLSILDFLQPNNKSILNEEVRAYFNHLYADQDLQNRIRQYYEENDPTEKTLEALKRAFGDHLTLQNIDKVEGANFMERFHNADAITMKYLIALNNKKD